jgi:hypothetical protein
MKLNKSKMLEVVRKQLAIDMNCTSEDFLKEGLIFCEAKENEGRRMFERQSPFLEVATMGRSTVVSADREVLTRIKSLLENRRRDEVFSAPFLYGHSLYYIPDCERIKRLSLPKGFDYCIKEGEDIYELYKFPGFENAIMYDRNNPRPDVIAICAMWGSEIAGVAGASADSSLMWQIGIDVLPQFRNKGIASSLVSNLAILIMEKGIVPYYGTASSNIASQAVAYRSGFMPAWMCTFKNTFDGTTPYESYLSINI